MNKLSLTGFTILVTGLTLLVFKGISAIMKVEMKFPDSTIESMLTPDKLEWIDTLSPDFVYNTAVTLVATPLYIYCLCLGTLLLILGGLIVK